MSRSARLISIDYPHHVVQRGNNKAAIFLEREDWEIYCILLKRYTKKWSSLISAYCLMTNHIHLLIRPKNLDSLAKCMQGVDQCYAMHFNKKYAKTGRLWENRYYSSIVDSDEYLWTVARYIEQNPVTANMVKRPEDYPYSSARANLFAQKDALLGEKLFKGKERLQYRKFMQEMTKQEEIKKIESSLKA